MVLLEEGRYGLKYIPTPLFNFTLNYLVLNPSSRTMHKQILQTDLHTFLLGIVERIWFKFKAFSLW